ncbi:transforming growth factor beta receptor type 3-like isoform X2 [Watersipora subatra]
MAMEKGCVFTSNADHYSSALEFEGNMCGSRDRVDSHTGLRTINNSVVFKPPVVRSTDQHIFYDDDEDSEAYSSGSGEAEVFSDLHTISIPFACTYEVVKNAPQQYHPITAPQHGFLSDSPANNISYKLRVFNNKKFTKPFQATHSVSMGTTLYIQIRADNAGGSGGNFFIHNCYFESEEGSLSSSTPYFIRNGCPIDPTVIFMEENRTSKERLFSLKIHSLNGARASFSCDLQPCSLARSRHVGLPQCGGQMSYCTSKFTGHNRQVSVDWPYSLKGEGCQKATSCNCYDDGIRNSEVSDRTEVELWMVILIAIAAFFIGSLAMGVLWCFYSKNGTQSEVVDSAQSQQQKPPDVRCKLMNSSVPAHVI